MSRSGVDQARARVLPHGDALVAESIMRRTSGAASSLTLASSRRA
jgi:hypothetical protein